MAKIGDQVVFYTHEASDKAHRAVDELAFVVGVVNDSTVDVVVTGPNGPWRWERVSKFDLKVEPTAGPRPVGLSYWRTAGEPPPDFVKVFEPPPKKLPEPVEGAKP